MAAALEGVFVVDASEGVAGAYCSRLLADLGADVVKVEPPGGDSLRRMGPFPAGGADPECSGLFLHLNANKRGILLDADDAEGREKLDALLAGADILIHSFRAARIRGLRLDYESLSHLNPRLVVTSVTPFGLSGPYAGWKSDEVVSGQWAATCTSAATRNVTRSSCRATRRRCTPALMPP